MFDVGFGEIVLTSFIALVVLGPEKLPKVARQVGNWMGRARVMARQLTEQLEREVTAEELLRAQNKTARRDAAEQPPVIAPPTAPNPPPAFDSDAAPSSLVHEPAPVAADAPDPQPEPAAPVHGLPASATTAAAMHANDPPSEPDSAHREMPAP